MVYFRFYGYSKSIKLINVGTKNVNHTKHLKSNSYQPIPKVGQLSK